MFFSKDDARDAIKASAARFKKIADNAKGNPTGSGYETYMRKYRLLGELYKKVDSMTLEAIETDLENIIRCI